MSKTQFNIITENNYIGGKNPKGDFMFCTLDEMVRYKKYIEEISKKIKKFEQSGEGETEYYVTLKEQLNCYERILHDITSVLYGGQSSFEN